MVDGVIVAARVGRKGVKVGSDVRVGAGVKVGGILAGSVSGAVRVRVGSRGRAVLVGAGVLVGGRVGDGVPPGELQAKSAKSSRPTNTLHPFTRIPIPLTI